MDGIEAARELRRRYDVPVIFSTGYADNETIERSKSAEPSGCIVKPFEEKELRSAIEIALYKHKMDVLLKKSKADLLRAQRIARVGNWEWDVETGKVEWSE